MTLSSASDSAGLARTPYDITRAIAEALGDQWSSRPGPGGTTGHLSNADGIPFTFGICEAGLFYVRNDYLGEGLHFDLRLCAPTDRIVKAVTYRIDELF
ncbi:hypothetical protein SMD44_p10038 (plasmid) [Streptomyces alboflavus]|uniref:Uncharacterized protein n=1 Tax=Streptomyces alboflavus TaxID=67267 RepID=A0A291W3P2_9ACTN|nr:hypothetical protein [Streptomyces alboflavus]ATM24537.1 hypothetical protein SMD44_p10038 [Streptomyces alboflavus]